MDLNAIRRALRENQEQDQNQEILEEKTTSKYQELHIKVQKIIYEDKHSGFALFKASSDKPVFSNIQGVQKREFNFTVKMQDKDNINVVALDAELILIGHWIEDEHYGVQFSTEDVSQPEIKDEKNLAKFIKSGGMKYVSKDLAQKIIQYSEKKKIDLLALFSDPMALKKISHISDEDEFRPRNIAFEWFHYKQSQLFANLVGKLGLKRGKAIKIYTAIVKKTYGLVTSEKENKIVEQEFLQKSKTRHFLKAKELMKIKDKTFKEEIEHYKHFYLEVKDFFYVNPYDFLSVNGIGFKTLDEFALNIPIEKNDPRRVAAMITELISNECTKTGNTMILREEAFTKISQIEGMTREKAIEIFKDYAAKRKIINRKIMIDGKEEVYITTDQFFVAEYTIAQKIDWLIQTKQTVSAKAIEEICSENFNNDKSQSEAILNSYQNSVSIITGGPGSGKTTTLKKLLYVFKKYEDKKIFLLAPTGKAAKRIGESVYSDEYLKEAGIKKPSTIHLFNIQQTQMIDDAIFIIDESSMIDVLLMQSLIKKIGSRCRLIFVGDIDQIPPVGIGQVMRDLISSQKVPISYLRNIHRTSEDSTIPDNAKLINQGKMPKSNGNYLKDDYAFIACENDEDILEKLKEIIPSLLKQYEKSQIQVISPQHSGRVGISELNKALRPLLNEKGNDKPSRKGKEEFIDGDRVINNKNDYENNVFNGEIGIAKNVSMVFNGQQTFDFYKENEKPALGLENTDFSLAYAITVHKSQGSEAPVIIFPVSRAHSFMLNKFLLYTGVTRASQKVIILGDLQTFIRTLNKNKVGKRLTSLCYEMDKWKEHEEVYHEIMRSDFYEDAISEEM